MLAPVTVVALIAILVGLCGVIVPVLPGSSLIVGAIAIWALVAQDRVGWWVLGIAAVTFLAGWALQYLLPGKALRSVGVPNSTMIVGAVVGVIAMFVLPVAGLPLGFVAGVLLAEIVRMGSLQEALPSTRHAVKAAVMSYGIELTASMIMAVVWAIGVQRLLF